MTSPLAEAIRVLRDGTGLPVSVTVPNPRPNRFLRVTRAGGRRDRSVDHMLLIVECWAADSVQAEQDAIAVHTLLLLAPDGSDVITAFTGATIVDFPDPDPAVSGHRFQVTGTLHCLTTE